MLGERRFKNHFYYYYFNSFWSEVAGFFFSSIESSPTQSAQMEYCYWRCDKKELDWASGLLRGVLV